MDIKVTPGRLSGKVCAPPSKSVAHRLLISAALAQGVSHVDGLAESADILATINAMKALGADIDLKDGRATVRGISKPSEKAVIDCCESGSTLRFIIPVAAALGVDSEFHGEGKLPERPITPYIEELPKHGAKFGYRGTMPFTVSGKLTAGEYPISGGISSQFITGLIFGLSLLEGDSEIVLTSKLESKPYVDITIGALEEFGVEVKTTDKGYFIKGGQKYKAHDCTVEGDHSQAAFFEVADALGSDVEISGLNVKSFQGDKKIIEICKEIVYNNNERKPFTADVADIPDLVPVLSVLACFCNGESRIVNAARLRIKECDRLAAMEDVLGKMGADIRSTEDSLIINGCGRLKGGADVSAYNDHRIAMSAAIAAAHSEEPVIIRGAECVRKSYPDFWEVFRSVGGNADEVL